MMKQKVLFSVLALLALLVVNTGSALADGTVTGMSVSRNGGLAFTFTVTGYLSPSQLKGGYVQEQGGKSYDLNCAQKDEFTVVCHTSGAIHNGVTVGFGGSTYWVEGGEMPQPHVGGQQLVFIVTPSSGVMMPIAQQIMLISVPVATQRMMYGASCTMTRTGEKAHSFMITMPPLGLVCAQEVTLTTERVTTVRAN
ncbi:MAG: hypothetical protein IPP55_08535 [Anaerolineales bacterium]|nr:hypothetical protein [Anaerolineales bacterium]